MGCAFNIKIVHPEETVPINTLIKPVEPEQQDESSVDTYVIDSPDFEYKKELE